jgi:hypothetical protein
MAGIGTARGRNGQPLGKFRFWFIDKEGKRRYRMGTADRRETLAIAKHLEAQHREVRGQRQIREELGLPSVDVGGNAAGKYAEVVRQYVAFEVGPRVVCRMASPVPPAARVRCEHPPCARYSAPQISRTRLGWALLAGGTRR